MKKIYIARRIPQGVSSNKILSVNPTMTTEDIHRMYVEKEEIMDSFIYNGPWILRPPVSNTDFSVNQMPKLLKPFHIWNMVQEKIKESNVVLGVVNNLAYGTIAEVGYACACKNIAVYVLPDTNVSSEELQDLWFIFQIAQTTRSLWSDEDIQIIPEFSVHDIHSLDEYERFVETIVPNFMKK